MTGAPTPGSPTVHVGPIEGATVPGTDGGKFGPGFDLAINSQGAAVFQTSVVGGNADTGVFLFFAGSSATQTLALEGHTYAGDTFNSFGAPVNNDSGYVAVKGNVNGSQKGLYLFFAGNPSAPPVVQAKTGPTFSDFGNPSVNNSNYMASQVNLTAGGQGVYLFFAGSPTQLAATNGSDGQGLFFNTFGPAIISNNSNKVAAKSTLTNGQQGLYLFFAGNPVTRFAKTGDSDGSGKTFSTFGDPVANSSDRIVASATTTDGSKGLYLFFAGSPAIKLANIPPSGSPTGVGGNWVDFLSPVMSSGTDASQISVVARGTVTGGSESEGLFLFFAGSPLTAPSLIVDPGDSPLENPAITFAGTSPVFPYHAMNNNLSIVFVAKTTGVSGSTEGVFFATLDQDSDSVADAIDNCPQHTNPSQVNTDQARFSAGYAVTPDTLGDACDTDMDGDSLLNYPPGTSGREPSAACNLLPDCDADGYLDNVEQPNCITNWNIWTVGTGDTDCDGYPDTTSFGARAPESYIGTFQTQDCASTPSIGDEPTDSWPPDFNDNQITNGGDWLTYNSRFGVTVSPPNPNVRWDLNASGLINGADMLQLNPFMNKRCN
jgi:hypothetical protein